MVTATACHHLLRLLPAAPLLPGPIVQVKPGLLFVIARPRALIAPVVAVEVIDMIAVAVVPDWNEAATAFTVVSADTVDIVVTVATAPGAGKVVRITIGVARAAETAVEDTVAVKSQHAPNQAAF